MSAGLALTFAAVALYVPQPATIDITAREQLRLDRLVHDADTGYSLQRHGSLIAPGATALRLPAGVYHFRAEQDVTVDVAEAGAVRFVAQAADGDKDEWPDPKIQYGDWTPGTAVDWSSHVSAFAMRGRASGTPLPRLTVTGADVAG